MAVRARVQDVERFVSEHGLVLLSHLRPDQLEARYFTGSDGGRGRTIPACFGMAHAAVADAESDRAPAGARLEAAG